MVIELDVRHGGDLRTQVEDGAIRLVAFDDEPALPHTRVPAELRHDPADDPRRIVAELTEGVRDHGGRRRLPVRAADHDRGAQRDDLGEEVRARSAFDPSRVRRRDDDLEALRRSGLAADLDIDAANCLEKDRVPDVPARDLGAPGARDVRVRRQAGATDPDEVETPTGERKSAHRLASASAISSSATRSAAFGFASTRIDALMRASRSGSASSSSASAGTRASSLWSTTTAPPPASK